MKGSDTVIHAPSVSLNEMITVRDIDNWLSEYSESHGHVINKLLHWICVPAIIFSILGLLWQMKIPAPLDVLLPENLAITAALMCLVYYFMLSLRLALGMVLVCGAMLLLIDWLDRLQAILWEICLVVFICAWAGQFIGHIVEGKRPSFFKDLQFLLIGPLWLLAGVYRKLRISY